jgi:hypothetical protein
VRVHVRVQPLLAVGLLALGACVVRVPSLFALVVPIAAVVPLLVLLVRRLTPTATGEMDSRLLQWTLGAFALHLAIGLAISHWPAASNYFGTDATLYHQGAQQLAHSWSAHSAAPTLPAGKEGYFYELGILYYVFGAHPEAGLVVNAFFAAALVPVLTDATRRLFGEGSDRYVAPLVVLLPGFVIWTSQLLREATIILLIALALDLALRASERTSIGLFASLSAVLAVLFTMRANVAYVMLGGLVIGLVLSRRQLVAGLSLGTSILSLSLLLVVSGGIGYSGYRTAANADFKQVQSIHLDSGTSAASGFGQSKDLSTPAHAATYLPYGLAQFALGPLPWQVKSIRQLPALLDVLALWLLLPSLWRGIAESRRRQERRSFIALIPAAITACMLALLVANFGTVVRERMQVLVLLIPFISLGLTLRGVPRPGHGGHEEHRANALVGRTGPLR